MSGLALIATLQTHHHQWGVLVFPRVGDPFLSALIALFTRAYNECSLDVCVWGDFGGVETCLGKLMQVWVTILFWKCGDGQKGWRPPPPLMAGGGKTEWETRHLRPTCVWATESENGCSHLSRRTHACIIIIIVYKCKLSIHCCHHKITLQ